jgi:hypothetical protein
MLTSSLSSVKEAFNDPSKVKAADPDFLDCLANATVASNLSKNRE